MSADWRILEGDCRDRLRDLDAGRAHTCITSPPYFGLRDYGHDGQLGLEATPDEYVAALVDVFREVRRVLRDDGTVWLNLGDSYASSSTYNTTNTLHTENGWKQDVEKRPNAYAIPGVKPKDLLGIPWLVAFALRADGWYLRSDIIWAKPNPMPESVTDRPTKAHEYLFLLSKGPRYFYDADAIREPHTDVSIARQGRGRSDDHKWTNGPGKQTIATDTTAALHPNGANKRSVWTVATQPYPGAHFATFPPKLIEPCVLAGCPERACEECGAPWERVVEREPSRTGIGGGTGYAQTVAQQGFPGSNARRGMRGGGFAQGATIAEGFAPSCINDAPTVPGTVPGTVLDPFAGSGTTGLVALRHGRSFIGIEANQEYVRLARNRIVDDAPLMNSVAEAASAAGGAL